MGPAYLAPIVAALALGPAASERWRPPELLVREGPPVVTADELRAIALQYVGRPYVMGGVGSPGFDCSGFTCRVYAEAGYGLPRVSRDQALVGRPVELDRLAPGDLVFYVAEPGDTRITHVGLYLGDGEVVHASTGEGRVVVADGRASWFARRLVAARRILPDAGASPDTTPDTTPEIAPLVTTFTPGTTTSTSPSVRPRAPRAIELVEHSGDSVLAPMLRLPARRPVPPFGPTLAAIGATNVALRSAVITEAGVGGLVLVPEATLQVPSIAFGVVVAVPVRFELDAGATVGALARVEDWTRFVRGAWLGLRGADLELRLSRHGDLTLLDGLVVDRLTPASAVRGVPGLTIARSPLSFFGRHRGDGFELEALVDDVVDPGLFGASVAVELVDRLELSAGIASDQRSALGAARRALNAAEARVELSIVESRRWSFELAAGGAFSRAGGEDGLLGAGTLFVERRFGASSVSLSGRASRLGPHSLAGLFGPTYAVDRGAFVAALAETGARTEVGGELRLGLGRFGLVAAAGEALGEARHPLDRRLLLLAEVTGLGLGGTRLLDLRVAWAARAVFDDGRLDALHASARLRLASWAHAEVYVEKGLALEGGAGLSVSFAP